MSKVSGAFKNGKAFIAFITGGDPDLETTKKLILEMQDKGADIIEVGIPFSDPIAEGSVIQEADLRALRRLYNRQTFDAIKEIKRSTYSFGFFMTYINVIFRYGTEKFMKDVCGMWNFRVIVLTVL